MKWNKLGNCCTCENTIGESVVFMHVLPHRIQYADTQCSYYSIKKHFPDLLPNQIPTALVMQCMPGMAFLYKVIQVVGENNVPQLLPIKLPALPGIRICSHTINAQRNTNISYISLSIKDVTRWCSSAEQCHSLLYPMQARTEFLSAHMSEAWTEFLSAHMADKWECPIRNMMLSCTCNLFCTSWSADTRN